MSDEKKAAVDTRYFLTNPMPHHYEEIQDLCRRVYPFSKPWSIAQLESHRSYFPDGQLIVVDRETGKIIGLAFSLIIAWSEYSHQDNWQDFTAAGFFHNHNPRKGQTLYGAEVMVDPETRGRGIGRLLYEGRWKIVEKYKLKRIRAGARLRGFSKFKDKMSVEEYVKAVVKKEIYDPTLSFQLNQGFKVIDVAANYLFNDPESLGYAAVIELINPDVATSRDLENQRQSVQQFLSDERYTPRFLPKELRRLVRKATQTLGEIIQEQEGEKFLRKVEFHREQVKKARHGKNKKILESLFEHLKKETRQDRLKLAHAFSLQLELVNVCEAAYRTWRLRQKASSQGVKTKSSLTYVLTAHPTEARSQVTVGALDQLEQALIEGVHNGFVFNDSKLASQIRMLWVRSLSKSKRPSVIDEAEYIYSLVFAPDTFDFILTEKPSYELHLQTWVGGDRKGDPEVNAEVMKTCLTLSRRHIVRAAVSKLDCILMELEGLEGAHRPKKSDLEVLRTLRDRLKPLEFLGVGDGTKIKTWTIKLRTFMKGSGLLIQKHHQAILLMRILELFPALVLPIELREDAGQIAEALIIKKAPIRIMLAELTRIAGALDQRYYARGLVVSQCESSSDIETACALVEMIIKRKTFPVVPLFENRESLVDSKKILRTWLSSKKNLERVNRHWAGKFEVMLGYSDVAKQIGALPSRYLIARAMVGIEKLFKRYRVTPIFFHGSGGSISRGGGSLKEQISWWSQSAVENPKLTVQGEMIQRLFSTKEILHSQCVHLTNEILRRKVRKVRIEKSTELERFVDGVRESYIELFRDEVTLRRLLDGTPFRYLDTCKVGSRLSRRPIGRISPATLSVIPWVLCWTQSRVLIPAWWGIGSVWQKTKEEDRSKLKRLFNESAFFSSFVKTLGFTLAKVELDVWELYFDEKRDRDLILKIRAEYSLAVKFLNDVSGKTEMIWYRPWLEESVRLRSSNIHLLNLLQIQAMRSEDEDLLKETLVGIGCGMLTTG